MNKYHRYLNLPFEIKKPDEFNYMTDHVQHINLDDTYDCSELNNWLKKIGIEIEIVEAFYTPPGGELPIHADYITLDDHCKINLTWGPKEGTIRWWNILNGDPIVISSLQNLREKLDDGFEYRGFTSKDVDTYSVIEEEKILIANQEDCELIYEANTNHLSLVNTGALHSTYNPTTEGRWTLCFVLMKDNTTIKFDDAAELLKNYIGENNENI
jgi:hypothetical protein